jgi:telomere length regulation protein
MIVSMTISRLTDKKENQLTFTDDAMETAEAKWYHQLVHVDDKVGQLDDIRKAKSGQNAVTVLPTKTKAMPPSSQKGLGKRTQAHMPTVIPSGLRIIELDSDEEDDLVPYAKPDSDPEDEDEDPTLIQRNKPKAPV